MSLNKDSNFKFGYETPMGRIDESPLRHSPSPNLDNSQTRNYATKAVNSSMTTGKFNYEDLKQTYNLTKKINS